MNKIKDHYKIKVSVPNREIRPFFVSVYEKSESQAVKVAKGYVWALVYGKSLYRDITQAEKKSIKIHGIKKLTHNQISFL